MNVWKLGGITTTRVTIIHQLSGHPKDKFCNPAPQSNYEAVKRKGQIHNTR